jgi:hypothetical protein
MHTDQIPIRFRRWLLAVLLVSPAIIPYISHWRQAHAEGAIPTGFLMYDMPYYMANARAHFAGGHFHLLYALPFSADDNSPRVYFQPHTLLLGLMWRFSPFEVNTVFLIFTAIASLVCARVAIALYEQIVGFRSVAQRVGLLLFFWGGGAIVIAGAIRMWMGAGDPGLPPAEQLFHFDPQEGWWFLNFGRNLIFGTEAYYHALFFGAILLCLRARYILCAVCALVLSMSHPFTGLELVLILLAWSGTERILFQNRAIPIWFIITTAAILAWHLGYYLWFLPRSPEHADLMKSWRIPEVLTWPTALAAYAIVLPFAIFALHSSKRFNRFFAQPNHRLLGIWLIVVAALVKHDLFIRPVQPLHFERGYLWTAIFFIGARVLIAAIDRILQWKRPLAMIAITGLCALFVLDNAVWLTTFRARPFANQSSVRLTPARQQVLHELNNPKYAGALVVSQDASLAYLVTAYTPLRSWYSHLSNTPYFDQHLADVIALFRDGRYADAWRHRRVVVIVRNDQTPDPPAVLQSLDALKTFKNRDFTLFLVPPSAK